MKQKIIGPRTLKTAIALVIGLVLCQYLKLKNPSIVAAAIITSMASNIHESFFNSIFRLLATLLGVLLAIFFQYINFANAFSAGLGVLIIIIFCNLTKLNKALVLATFIFVSVLSYEFTSNQNFLLYAFHTMVDNVFGLFIGVFINITLFKPKLDQVLLANYESTFALIKKSFVGLLVGLNIKQEKLISKLQEINANSVNLQNEKKIMLNQKLDIKTIEFLNNKFRLAISLLIDLNQSRENFTVSQETRQVINDYYGKALLKESTLTDESLKDHTEIALNIELEKIIKCFKDIDLGLKKLS